MWFYGLLIERRWRRLRGRGGERLQLRSESFRVVSKVASPSCSLKKSATHKNLKENNGNTFTSQEGGQRTNGRGCLGLFTERQQQQAGGRGGGGSYHSLKHKESSNEH